MKLPNLTTNLIKGLQEARSERLNTLSHLLSMGVGKILSAEVEKVSTLNQEQRQQLLNRTLETLMQLVQKPTTPAQSKQVSQLLAQQQLLSSPLLKLVQLKVNNQTLLTYTDKPVQPGQTIKLSLTDANRLVLLDNIPKPAPGTSTGPQIQQQNQ